MANLFTIRITSVRTALRAASVLIALLTSGSCYASCGEYVFSRHRMPTPQVSNVSQIVAGSHHDAMMSERFGLSKDIGVLHETPLPAPNPCNGPNCHQSPTPSLPVAPQSTAGSSQEDRLISGQSDFAMPAEVSRRRELNDLARALRGFPLLIEMPPEFVG